MIAQADRCAAQTSAPAAVVLGSIDWDNNLTPEADRALREASAPWIGAPLKDVELDERVNRLTAALRSAGFPVARVLVTPEGRRRYEAEGRLSLRAFEGKVGAIEVRNTSAVQDEQLRRVATQALCPQGLGAACPLTTQRLERTTQLLQDLPGLRFTGTSFSAQEVGVGETRVILQTAAAGARYNAQVGVDNHGLAATGVNRIWGSLSANNLLGLSEAVDLTLGTTNRSQRSGRLGVGAPLGVDGLRWTASLARTNYGVSAAGVAVSGVADTGTVGLAYPIRRGLDDNLNVALDLVGVRSRVEADDFGVTLSRKRLVALRATVLGNSGDRSLLTGGNHWSWGASVLGGRVRNDAGQGDPAEVDGGYWKLSGQVLRRQTLDDAGRTYLLATVRGQWASRNLDPYEKLPLGGVSGVRAYRGDEGSLDDGLIASIELRRRFTLADSFQVAPGAFVDYGMGRVNHRSFSGWQTYQGLAGDVSNRRSLSAYGLAVDLSWSQRAVLGVVWARRFGASADSINFPGSAQGRLWANLSLRF